MEFGTFRTEFERAVPAGTVIANPGGGTSEVLSYASDHVTYKRGISRIRVSLAHLHTAYEKFSGGGVSSNDLKKFMPAVFDSGTRPAGHSCNCTFLFSALKHMGYASRVNGSGVRGSPYSIDIVAEATAPTA